MPRETAGTHGRVRWAAAIGVVVACALVRAHPARADGTGRIIPVRVCGGTPVSARRDGGRPALDGEALRTAGIVATWTVCARAAPPRRVHASAGRRRAGRAQRDVRQPRAARGRAAAGHRRRRHGDRHGHARDGVADRVADLARAARSDESALLGRAIAHGSVTCSMASTWRTASGLMRPLWRRREVGSARDADWVFGARKLPRCTRRGIRRRD